MPLFGKKKKTVNIKDGEEVKTTETKSNNLTQVYNIKRLRFCGKCEAKLEEAYEENENGEDPPELDYKAFDEASDKKAFLETLLSTMPAKDKEDFIAWITAEWEGVRKDVLGL